MRRRSLGIAPDEQPLRARPNAVQDAPFAVIAKEVAIAVAEEATGTGAQVHEPLCLTSGARSLLLANVGLVIWHAEVFAPILRRNLYRLASAQGRVNHALIHALGVH